MRGFCMVLIRWLGHAAFHISLDGWSILIDPWITNPASPYKTVDQFVKDYGKVDLIIVTHDHGDHVGEAVELLRRYPSAKIAALYELANHIAKEAGAVERSIPANIGGPVKLGGLTLIFTEAHHSSSIAHPSGVVVIGKSASIYHAGDTGLFAEMAFIGELYKPTIALLPIGGHFTMGPLEAAKAVELIKPRYVIPMHYNTFDVIRVDPAEFEKLVKERGVDTKVVVLKPGEKFELPE